MDPHLVALAVIAGGKGERLGGVPKGLLRMEGRTLLERQLGLARPGEQTLVVSSDASYQASGARCVPDIILDRGAPGGVHSALVHAGRPWVVVLGCDMPFVTRPVVDALLAQAGPDLDAVCFEVNGRLEALLAVYRSAAAGAVAEALACQPSFRELYRRLKAKVLPQAALEVVDPTLRASVSINLKTDLERWGIEPISLP